MRFLLLALVACAPEAEEPDELLCHGRADLCDRPFDQVALVMAHNAMSSESEGWRPPNQGPELVAQLDLGVRGFMMDTYDKDGTVVLCHGYCELGERPLSEALADISAFLERTSDPIVWVIQDAASAEATIELVRQAGLEPLTYAHPPGAPWPTLGELRDTPFIVTTEFDRRSAGVDWYQPAYELAWDNPYSAESEDDFTCDPLRGSQDNAIFLLNHFLTAPFADRSLAQVANTEASLSGHIDRCEQETGDLVNWVAVDFVDEGAAFDVVDALNDGR